MSVKGQVQRHWRRREHIGSDKIRNVFSKDLNVILKIFKFIYIYMDFMIWIYNIYIIYITYYMHTRIYFSFLLMCGKWSRCDQV